MSAPLPIAAAPDSPSALALALGIGVAFGWTLERAGLGSARKLMGQFLLTDLTVFKTMFAAIVTAMLGLFWLEWLGVLDMARVHVPDTWVAPQLAGGIVFGAGLALAGLCPGTSCVSAVSGRLDGLAVMAGFLTGVLATGALLPAFQGFYESGAHGALTLAQGLGVTPGAAVLGVVVLALAGFAAAERIERTRRPDVAREGT